MIKPYFQEDHSVSIVEVEYFGVINLNELPIKTRLDQKGNFYIDWVLTEHNKHVLSEFGGTNQLSFGGMTLGVIREIE